MQIPIPYLETIWPLRRSRRFPQTSVENPNRSCRVGRILLRSVAQSVSSANSAGILEINPPSKPFRELRIASIRMSAPILFSKIPQHTSLSLPRSLKSSGRWERRFRDPQGYTRRPRVLSEHDFLVPLLLVARRSRIARLERSQIIVMRVKNPPTYFSSSRYVREARNSVEGGSGQLARMSERLFSRRTDPCGSSGSPERLP